MSQIIPGFKENKTCVIYSKNTKIKAIKAIKKTIRFMYFACRSFCLFVALFEFL
jgi:hypothetical protein